VRGQCVCPSQLYILDIRTVIAGPRRPLKKSFCYLIDFHWNGKDFEYRTKDDRPGLRIPVMAPILAPILGLFF
jgi:hypothetical protein